MGELDAFLASVQAKALRIAEFSLGSREDALDVIQDAMYKFVQKYGNKPADQWPPLFYRILYNRITDYQRQRQRSKKLFFSFFGRDNADDQADEQSFNAEYKDASPVEPERLNDSQRFAEDLDTALKALPERQRQAFLLREWEGLDVASTALAMGCSDGSVKTHLSRAKRALQQHLQAYDHVNEYGE